MNVCIYADNSCTYVDILLNVWRNGDCAVLIDPRIPLEKAIEQMISCDVKKCYTDKESIDHFHEAKLNFVNIHKEETKFFQQASSCELFPKVYWERDALILFSSGTTGAVKGVILSYFSIQKNAEMIIDYLNPNAEDKLYIVKSLAHSSTVVGELLVALKTNTPILLGMTTQHMSSLWHHIINNSITILCLNPTLFHLLAQYLLRIQPDASQCVLKKIYTSGSILMERDVNDLKKSLEFVQVMNVYGLTEAGPRITAQRQEEPVGSVGLPLKDIEIVITDETGRQLSEGENGIISVKTPCLFKGYVSGEASLKEPVYKNWLNTGDIGYVDQLGHLYITGRWDRMLTSGSHNVYPEQVEAVIIKFEGIQDCHVYGEDDLVLGKKLICIYEGEHEVTSQLLAYCRNHLAQYEIPKSFVHGTIPKTPNGKKRVE